MRISKKLFLITLFTMGIIISQAQETSSNRLAPTPPMGWMTWNLFGVNVNEELIRDMADAMISGGFADAGYNYIYIDDGWQGGRDNRNNIIPDAKKFPSGIKALADYVHSKGLKLGIYSDAAQLTCGGYTASFGFEYQDAKTFASWGIDYLKYDYCGAPDNVNTAQARYNTMANALRKSGRNITFGICEWGQRKPWLWAAKVGGQLWRTTFDVRDKWKDNGDNSMGILDIVNQNADLFPYAKPGAWNDMDMLVVGLYGKGGPSSDLNSHGCSDTEYESQMSLWSMMASPLAMTCDLRTISSEAKRILLNKEIIAINQDPLGKQAEPKIRNEIFQVYLKPLSGGRFALAILNISEKFQRINIPFAQIGLKGNYKIDDVWTHKTISKKSKKWYGCIQSHQTKVYVLSLS